MGDVMLPAPRDREILLENMLVEAMKTAGV
jgi:hypothetical protein